MGFFQNLFGKKTCALCGKECGMMHRTKVKNGEYVCSDCTSQCSKFVRLSRLTTDEVRGHIEYMRRQNRLFEEVFSTARCCFAAALRVRMMRWRRSRCIASADLKKQKRRSAEESPFRVKSYETLYRNAHSFDAAVRCLRIRSAGVPE